ncbi:hypothetical protein CJJ07_005496 [Candidozyma auris]|nr:hypothetical protein CJJ07_005496 [[Candida] auris]
MGYPSEIRPSIKKIAHNVVTLAVPFSYFNVANLGNRMAIFRYGNEIILWSPIPYGEYIEEAIDLLARRKENLEVTHLFVVNKEHNLVAKSYLETYPNIKIVAGEKALGKEHVHYEFSDVDGNKVIKGEEAEAKFNAQGDFWANFEFIYLTGHLNKELVLYEKNLHMLFEGDLLMDVGRPDTEGTFECYSPSTGYPHQYNPFTGISALFSQLKAGGWLGWFGHVLFGRTYTAKGAEGVKLVYESWDFDTIIQCHGNIISGTGKAVYAEIYPWLKKDQ